SPAVGRACAPPPRDAPHSRGGGPPPPPVPRDPPNSPPLPSPPSFADFSGVDGASHPELRIDGYLGGVKVASRRFSANPAADWLLLAADDAELIGDGADETRVVFRAVDAYRAPRPYARERGQL